MPNLFDPISVGAVTLKNRVLMPAMDMQLAESDGSVTDLTVRHYVDRARGGVGVIVTEHCFVSPEGRFAPKQIGIHDDSMLPGLKRLAGAIKQESVPLIAQISHAGARTTLPASIVQPVSPSGIRVPGADVDPRSLALEEIITVADAFVAAAGRAREAGFAGVEVHGAHGFLLSQFASPITNHREDEYGGSLENRFRLQLEIVRRVRAEIGEGMLLFYRLGADDMMDGGFSLEEAKKAAIWLQDVGVQLIDVSGGLIGSRPADAEAGYFVPLATEIKSVVYIPVAGVGGITMPAFAEKVIAEERVDLVAVGRAILKDPSWPKMAAIELGIGDR